MSNEESPPPKEFYQQYAGFYRAVESLSKPWEASPEVAKPKDLAMHYFQGAFAQVTPPSPTTLVTDDPPVSPLHAQPTSQRKRRGTKHALASVLRRWADKITGENSIAEEPLTRPLVSSIKITNNTGFQPDEVPLREWKAWAYYACPHVLNKDVGGFLRNYPSSPHLLPSTNVEQVFQSLWDESGFHPERWIPGLQHPAIPPRPERWKVPPIGASLPFPWEVQLNPLLQHNTFGRPPLDWDISIREINLGRTGDVMIPSMDPDRAQPATYPFVTHMYISSVGDDPYPEYFWPFFVVNEYGVTVGDVVDAIYENFQQYLEFAEYQSWSSLMMRQKTTQVAFEMRRNRFRPEGARRIDILGTQCLFRGLEPHPNHEGWTLFFGLG
ncbi:hypothetical protein H0H92_000697 [Tricholoma furcatifolium]|nr:hypothetical protein H0H92_000697 [Tricholoma furcatifolium]